MKYAAISSDSHINEPPDLWEKRLPKKFVDRGPRVIEAENGGHAWVMEDLDDPINLGVNAAQYKGRRYDRAHLREKFAALRDGWNRPLRFEEILPGSYDPAARLREQDEGGVQAEVLYNNPATIPAIKAIRDRELQSACFKAYNDWIAEYSAHSPARLIGLGAIPATGIRDAVAELRRCAENLQLRGVALESYPNGGYGASDEDDRFWAEAEELRVPINVHVTLTVPVRMSKIASQSGGGRMAIAMSADVADERRFIESGHFTRVLENLIIGGVFDRFPGVQVVGGEVQASWVPFYLQRFDDSYRRRWRELPVRLELLPSEYFRRNAKVTFMVDPIALKDRYLIGVDNMMWSTDFPHANSNWPLDVELAELQLAAADVPPAERERIMWRTCADLYGLTYEVDSAMTTSEGVPILA